MKAGTILLTEDEPIDALLLRRAFDKAGVATRLEVVSDGDETIAYLAGEGLYADRASHPLPDLVMLDIKLPRTSGLDVLAWIRGQPIFARLPVIMLTSSRQAADVRRAYEIGASAYHEKPGTVEGLIELVRNLNVASFVWTEPVASARSAVVERDDARMFPAVADQPTSVKSKIHRVLSRYPDGLTPEAIADELLGLGLAVGDRAGVRGRVEEILVELQRGRTHRRVLRGEDGRYRAQGLW